MRASERKSKSRNNRGMDQSLAKKSKKDELKTPTRELRRTSLKYFPQGWMFKGSCWL